MSHVPGVFARTLRRKVHCLPRCRSAADWPLPETRWMPYYLHGDGTLSPDAPVADAAPLSYDHDPAHPVPSFPVCAAAERALKRFIAVASAARHDRAARGTQGTRSRCLPATQQQGEDMHTGLVKRIVAGAFVGVVGGTLAVGTLLAQAPAPGAAGPAYPVDSIYGTWSLTPECRLEEKILTITPRLLLESGPSRTSHAFVTLEPVHDGVMLSPVRMLVVRNGAWATQNTEREARGMVLQRRGSTVVVVRIVDPEGRDQVADRTRADVLHACS